MPPDAYPFSDRYVWLEDKYCLSWQIVPAIMDQLMAKKDQAKRNRVTDAMLKMKKLNIAELAKAGS